MKKRIVFTLIPALFFGGTACWAASPDVYLSGSVTYGDYMKSIERDYILTERVNLSVIPDLTSGLTFHFENVKLSKNAGYEDINQNQYGISGYKAVPVEAVNGYLGGRLDVQYLNSDDALTDNTAIPYVAFTYKSNDGGLYLDLGYAHSAYNHPDVNQYTATVGASLLNGKSWSQTRFYVIDLNETTQGQNTTYAVEERLSYYVVPDKLTLSLYGLLGERIFAYDPDIYEVYNLADVQKGSLGGTVSYQLTPALKVLGDLTWEAYKNHDINDDYSVLYGTVMLSMKY